MHNLHRPARNGEDSFELVTTGIQNLCDAGVRVAVIANLGKRSMSDYPLLQHRYASCSDVSMAYDLLKDCTHMFGTGGFDDPDFSLIDENDFARCLYEGFSSEMHDAADYMALLQPIRNHCRRPLENYLMVDAVGDVCKCDGWMGDKSHVSMSVFDDIGADDLVTAEFGPHGVEECAFCPVLPQCLGYCRWEHELLGCCHPLKLTLESYLRDCRRCLEPADKIWGGRALVLTLSPPPPARMPEVALM